MTIYELKNNLISMGYDDIIIFENPSYASAFIGITTDNRCVYDYNLMIKKLMTVDKMTSVEAIDFTEYNTMRSLPYYENSPIVINLLEDLL